jgi:tetratricopeptide (TPR) repeat protein
MQAGLDGYTARKDWEYAAIAASNLSELYQTTGDLGQALEFAEQSVDLADQSGDAFRRTGNRTGLANALHQAGRTAEAEALFGEAEAMQKEFQPEYRFLYSAQGFRYCELLLGRGKHQEVQDRATQTLEWATEWRILLDIALITLSLGRADLALAQHEGRGDFSMAAEHLDQAVDGLRRAGTQDHIPRGLLARAALHRMRGDFEPARRDLDEALAIAERGGMGLHRADGHLEFARLYLAMGEEPSAREHLASAKGMVGCMGYKRRDGEVAELEAELEKS